MKFSAKMIEQSLRDSFTAVLNQLFFAIQQNNLSNVEGILSSINAEQINNPCGPLQINALQIACFLPGKEGVRMVNLLISHGANPANQDKLGRTPLHFAATNGNLDVVAILLNKGAHINAKYELVIRKYDPQFTILDNQFKPDIYFPLPECLGRTPLHQAVKGNHKDVVKLLLLKGAFVNALDEHGVTPLLLAGAGVQKDKRYNFEDYEEIVSLLIEFGADVNAANNFTGTTALHHAVAIENVKVTTALLNANAYIKEASSAQTPLHEAAERGNAEILQLLIDFEQGQINEQDNAGRTVVHKAAFAGSRDCVRLLVEYGGDLSMETKSKMSVIEAIFKYVPRPIDLMQKILNSKVTCNNANINSVDFRLNLNFGVLAPTVCSKQMSVLSSLMDITSDTEMNDILQHPLIETYLLLKWERLRIFFTMLVSIYLIFVLSLSTYVMIIVHEPKWAICYVYIFKIILLISTSSIFFHSIIQFCLAPRHYFKQYEMWINLVCASLSIVIGICGKDSIQEMKSEETESTIHNNWILHVMSITVLLAWTELMLLIGRFPNFGYYALMFSTVLQNVIKVLLTFVCLVIGFAISFSVQFYSTNQFDDPWKALVKTTLMMMGEYDYGSLFKDRNSTVSIEPVEYLPITSRIIFLMFVIIASIVLVNLMVGLAVNDIHAIQTSGHVQRLVKQAMFLLHLETILSHKLFKSSLFPEQIYKALYSRRCIPTEVTFKPKHITDHCNNMLINLIVPRLMESLVKTAVNTRKKSQPQDYDASVLSMFQNMQEQILEIKNMIDDLKDSFEIKEH